MKRRRAGRRRGAAWPGAALLVALAFSGCTPEPTLETPAGFALLAVRTACDQMIQCGLWGASERAHCEAMVESLGVGPPDLIEARMREGTLVYDAKAAADCLASIAAATCQNVPAHPPSCRAALSGKTQPGLACKHGFECLSGLCDFRGAICPGVCARVVGAGQSCNGAYCDGKSYCGWHSFCVAIAPDGGNDCISDSATQCAPGFACMSDGNGVGRSTCIKPLGEGEPCWWGEGCAEGLYCENLPNPVCRPRKGSGQSCTGNPECARGLRCVGYAPSARNGQGVCQPNLDYGDACTVDTSMFNDLVTGCPFSMPCTNGRCGVRGEDGATCDSGQRCQSQFCDPLSGRCAEPAPFGGECTPQTFSSGPACAAGRCDPVAHTCGDVCPM